MTDFKAIDLTGRSREDLLIIAERACATHSSASPII